MFIDMLSTFEYDSKRARVCHTSIVFRGKTCVTNLSSLPINFYKALVVEDVDISVILGHK